MKNHEMGGQLAYLQHFAAGMAASVVQCGPFALPCRPAYVGSHIICSKRLKFSFREVLRHEILLPNSLRKNAPLWKGHSGNTGDNDPLD